MGNIITFHEFLKLCWHEGWTTVRNQCSQKSVCSKHCSELIYCLLSRCRADKNTSGHFEYASMVINSKYLPNWACSTWIICQGCCGTKQGWVGALGRAFATAINSKQFQQTFSILVSIPGHYRWISASDFILSTPKWPQWSSWKRALWKTLGFITLVPHKMHSSVMLSSWCQFWNGVKLIVEVTGQQPCWTDFIIADNCWSFKDSFAICEAVTGSSIWTSTYVNFFSSVNWLPW